MSTLREAAETPPLTPRQQAEQAYSYAAHDYARDPVGSRDWVLFFTGWSAAMCQQEEARAAQAAELEAMRKRAETWELLYMRAINEANGLTNYVEDRPELSKIERKLVAIEAAARAALKEQTPNDSLNGARAELPGADDCL